MSKVSRDKGARAEREIIALHAELGIKAERVPLVVLPWRVWARLVSAVR
jgi:hypothetical protein